MHFAVEICLLPSGCKEHTLDSMALLLSGVCNMVTKQHGPVGRAGIWESLLLIMSLVPCSRVFLPCV